MKSVEIRKAINAADVASKAAQEVIDTLVATLKDKQHAHLALTGGTVGILTLEVLSKHPELTKVDFSKVDIWWGDERFVESESKDRNAQQAFDAWLNSSDIPAENIHPFPSSDNGLSLEDAKANFETTLAEHFPATTPKMDLTLLGMGPDGHVASIFPGHSESGNFVISVNDSPKPPAQRLSLSMDVINNSEKVIFVVAGIDKAEAVEQVHKNPDCDLPAAKVSALKQTLWIIDESAGAAFWSC